MDLQVCLDSKDLRDPKERWGWLDPKEILVPREWLVPLDLQENYQSFLQRFFSKKMSLHVTNEKSVEIKVPVLDLNRMRMWI